MPTPSRIIRAVSTDGLLTDEQTEQDGAATRLLDGGVCQDILHMMMSLIGYTHWQRSVRRDIRWNRHKLRHVPAPCRPDYRPARQHRAQPRYRPLLPAGRLALLASAPHVEQIRNDQRGDRRRHQPTDIA